MASRTFTWFRRVLLGAGLLLLIGVLAVMLLVRTGAGSEIARRKAEVTLSLLTGCDARVATLTLDLNGRRAEARDVTLQCEGEEIVRVPRVEARLGLSALVWIRRAPVIDSLSLESPVVRLNLDHLPPFIARLVAAAGPRAVGDGSPPGGIRSGDPGQTASPRIGRFRLSGGQVTLAQPSRRFEILLPNLGVESDLLLAAGQAHAALSSSAGRMTAGDARIGALSLRADLRFDGSALHVRDASLESAGLPSVSFEGRLGDATTGWLLKYASSASVDELCALPAALGAAADRAGPCPLPVSGALEIDGEVSGAGLRWSTRGTVRSGVLEWHPPTAGSAGGRAVPLREVEVGFRADAGGAVLKEIRARFPGGDLRGAATLRREDDIWLADVRSALRLETPRLLPVPEALAERMATLDTSGVLEITGTVPLSEPRAASGDWSLRLSPAGLGPGSVPLHASIAGRLRGDRLEFEEATARVGDSSLELSGAATTGGLLALDVALQSADLVRLSQDLAPLLPPLPGWLPEWLAGTTTFRGSIRGSVTDPRLAGRLEIDSLVLRDLPLGHLEAELSLSQDLLDLSRLNLLGGFLDLEARAVVNLPGSSAVRGEWSVKRLDLSALAAALGAEGSADGILAGAGRIAASDAGPRLEGVLSGGPLTLFDLTLDSARLQAAAGTDALTVHVLEGSSGTGRLTASGTLPWSGESGRLMLRADAIEISRLLGDAELTGRVTFDGALTGSVLHPHPAAPSRFAVHDLAWEGLGPLELLGDLATEGPDLKLTLADSAGTLHGEVRIRATPDLASTGWLVLDRMESTLPWGPENGRPQLSLGEARLSFEGPLREPRRMTTALEIRDARLGGEGWSASALEPIHLDGAGPDIRLRPIVIGMHEERLTLEGGLTLEDPPQVRLSLTGEAEMEILRVPLGLSDLSGLAVVDLGLEGPWKEPSLSGAIEVRNGFLRVPDFPQPLQRMTARFELEGHAIRIPFLRGDIGAGTIEGEGEIEMARGAPSLIRLAIEGRGVGLRFPVHLPSLSDFRLLLEGEPSSLLLSGDVDLIRVRLTQDFHLERTLLSMPTPPPGVAPHSPLDSVRLDLGITARDHVFLDNDLGRAEFAADLRLAGTAARPILIGELDAVRAGRLRFRGLDYTLTEASLIFSPGFPNDPEISALAEARVEPYEIEVSVTGRRSAPRVELGSDPPLARERILGLLLSGGSWSPALAGEATGGVRSPYDPLASYQASLAETVDIGSAGLDGTAADAAEAGNRFSFGRRVSENLTVRWSTLLGATGGDVIELRYRVSPNLEVRQARDDSGSNILETSYVHSFDTAAEPPVSRRPQEAGRDAAAADLIALSGVPEGMDPVAIREAIGLQSAAGLGRPQLLLAAERGRDVLARQGWPLARVDCLTDETTISCAIRPGPLVHLGIEGVRRKEKRRLHEAVREAWADLLLPEELPAEARGVAERFYRERGRAAVQTDSRLEAAENGSYRVVLSVRRGPRVRVTDVRIEGTSLLDARELEASLAAARHDGLLHPLLTPELLSGDAERLARLCFAAGLTHARVLPPLVEYPKEADEARVVFTLEEGARARVARVAFTGNRLFDEDGLRDRLDQAAGSTFNPTAVDAFARNLQADYDAQGYPDAAILWRLEPEGEDVAILIEVREGAFARVGEVRVEGNRRTREEVIRRELEVRSGDPLRRGDLAASQRRLERLGIFRSTSVRAEPAPADSPVRDVRVRVDERDNVDVRVGGGYDDEEGGRFSFAIGRYNLGGGTGSLGFYSRYGSQDRLAQVLAGARRLRGSPWDFLATLGWREEELPGFSSERTSLSAQLSRPFAGDRSVFQFGYSVQNVTLSDVDLSQSPSPAEAGLTEGILAGIGVSLARNTRDDLLDPSEGRLESVTFGVDSSALGSEEEFTRLLLSESWHGTFGRRRLGIGVSGRAALAWPFGGSAALPVSERFFAGGVDSVRGYERNSLGPRDPITGETLGGEARLVFNSELLLPLTARLKGVLFLDAGNVFGSPSSIDLSLLRWSYGPGLTISTPVGPIRLFGGRKIDPEPGEDRWEFQFTFGPTF